jgi:glycosyltransferase involved in cell wall biosynthesis
MVGDGPERDKYRDMMIERGLGKRISMLPAMRVQQAFAMSQNLVVPSRAEAMPYIVLEGLGAGKTIIATRVGGIPEALGRDSPALANPEDPDDLARAMADAIRIPGWHDTAMPSMEQVRSVFSASIMANDVLKLYHDLLDPQSKQAIALAS